MAWCCSQPRSTICFHPTAHSPYKYVQIQRSVRISSPLPPIREVLEAQSDGNHQKNMPDFEFSHWLDWLTEVVDPKSEKKWFTWLVDWESSDFIFFLFQPAVDGGKKLRGLLRSWLQFCVCESQSLPLLCWSPKDISPDRKGPISKALSLYFLMWSNMAKHIPD